MDVPTPDARIRALNDRPIKSAGEFVLYWMTAQRRLRTNFALQRAVELARTLGRPLLILEALRCDYDGANARFHRFIIDGMRDNAREAARSAALYYPYVEPSQGHGRGLIDALGAKACAIVADWFPAFFLPAMTKRAAERVTVRLEAVDSNGLLPLTAGDRAFESARSYRALVQRTLRTHLRALPVDEPLAWLAGGPRLKQVPPDVLRRWPAADHALLTGTGLDRLPVDRSIGPAPEFEGGSRAGAARLAAFVASRLRRYGDEHNHPDAECTSRLSPYLHFGHISAHDVFTAVMTAERWTTRKLAARSGGAREGWWGVSPSAEIFLDQLVVWRGLAYNGCEWIPGYAHYESLPEWARRTLEAHAGDPRPRHYTLGQLESASTDDGIWNAAQRQLVHEGWFHGYLRMLWGKKIVEWSDTPAEALARMERLMNRYSLDARDPNSYAGYTWVLGRYDRPWPERPVFGTVRCMTSDSTRRKLKMKRFLERYGTRPAPALWDPGS